MNKKPFASNDLLKMKWTGNPNLSPDGTKILYEVTTINEDKNSYVTNIWLWDGKRNLPFTTGSGNEDTLNLDPRWSPSGDAVAFISNRSGDKQLWVLDHNCGETFKATSAPAGVSSYCWSPDGSGLYYLAKERKKQSKFPDKAQVTHVTKLRYKYDGKGYLDNVPEQIYYVDLGSLESRQLTTDELGGGKPVVSPDNKLIAFSANRSKDEQDLTADIFLLTIADCSIRRVTPHNGRYRDPVFMPNGDLLCVGIDKHPYPGGYPHIWHINCSDNTITNLTQNYKEYIGKSIGNDASSERGKSGLTVSADGKFVYFVITKGGNCYLEKLEVSSGNIDRALGSDTMVVSSYDIVDNKIAVNIADPTSPGDIWYGTAEELERLTYLNADLFNDKYLGFPQPIQFTSPEGVNLEGWLIKPLDFCEGKKYPLIMEIHGGPHSTYGNIFFHEFQILAGNGYGVFYANPRGSIGYGEDFARAVVGDWCGCDARDLEFMAREVRQLAWVDENRCGVTGGSQGGYFTNWLISHCDIFSAAVAQRSMSNLYTKYGIADNGWNGDRYGMGGADLWDNEDFILERSPIRYAPNVNTPLLLIHSDQDLRCPLEQAEQWYVALKRLGNTTEMMIFHGENHNLSRTGKPANRLVRLDAIVDWFKKYC